MRTHTQRNDPCPCGSGKKYKQCCGDTQRFAWRKLRLTRGWMILALAGIAIVAFVYGWGARQRPGATSFAAPGVATGAATEPWAYDSVAKRHYDPTHKHWHDGPPPPAAAGGAAPPAAPPPPSEPTPAPWTYNPATNQHWDPNHGHWHAGPPPANPR